MTVFRLMIDQLTSRMANICLRIDNGINGAMKRFFNKMNQLKILVKSDTLKMAYYVIVCIHKHIVLPLIVV